MRAMAIRSSSSGPSEQIDARGQSFGLSPPTCDATATVLFVPFIGAASRQKRRPGEAAHTLTPGRNSNACQLTVHNRFKTRFGLDGVTVRG